MQKIMFNDRFELTAAVLEGRKTMTRRIVPISIYNQTDWGAVEDGNYNSMVDGEEYYHDIRDCGRYRVGEVVAIAQSYKELANLLAARKGKRIDDKFDKFYMARHFGHVCDTDAGWNNKMFVKADLMPHHIKITNIRVERLQNISEDDCLKEGICKTSDACRPYYIPNTGRPTFANPREAFAALIDKVSGKGTWDSNPWVFVYEFKLIK